MKQVNFQSISASDLRPNNGGGSSKPQQKTKPGVYKEKQTPPPKYKTKEKYKEKPFAPRHQEKGLKPKEKHQPTPSSAYRDTYSELYRPADPATFSMLKEAIDNYYDEPARSPAKPSQLRVGDHTLIKGYRREIESHAERIKSIIKEHLAQKKREIGGVKFLLSSSAKKERWRQEVLSSFAVQEEIDEINFIVNKVFDEFGTDLTQFAQEQLNKIEK